MTLRASHTLRAFRLALAALLLAGAAGAEEATVEAFSVYRSEGELSRTGPRRDPRIHCDDGALRHLPGG